jgi:hypothetical protein
LLRASVFAFAVDVSGAFAEDAAFAISAFGLGVAVGKSAFHRRNSENIGAFSH